MHKGLVTQKNSRDYQSNQICGQDRFTFRGRGETTEKKQHKENKFYLWLAYSRGTQLCDDRLHPSGHERQHEHRDRSEDEQAEGEIGKETTTRDHCPKILMKHAARIILPIDVT